MVKHFFTIMVKVLHHDNGGNPKEDDGETTRIGSSSNYKNKTFF